MKSEEDVHGWMPSTLLPPNGAKVAVMWGDNIAKVVHDVDGGGVLWFRHPIFNGYTIKAKLSDVDCWCLVPW